MDDIIINNSVEKLYIIGKSKESSVLKFNDSKGIILNNLLYEANQEIKFVNVTIIGHMELYSIVNVTIEDVILNGSALFDRANKYLWATEEYNYNTEYMEKNLYVTIIMKNFTFNALTNTAYRCLNLYGNVIINDSNFYGHSSCVYNLLDYNGESIYNLKIFNSYFNGMYTNKCLNIYNAVKSVIESSTFENGVANDYGG